jgi:uncharacterized protein YoxC
VSTMDADLQQRLDGVAQQLQDLESQLRSLVGEVQKLPFLAKAFVERDVSSATGRSLVEWAAACRKMQQSLLQAGTGEAVGRTAAVQEIDAELPRLAGLRTYLANAPQKMKMVPAALFKPQQQAAVLEQVNQQVAQLDTLETQLRNIGASLREP